ncbi:MAG: hypothetical protein CMJ85_01380 [Planctomycetes bacterium]|jgi:prepilin-type N-terminal cleavage/methylation domain-containing protein|nr:hypothetical protein [Planctomycetota bacterium]
MQRNHGFTLIELLVVIGILSMLFVVLLGAIGTGQAAANQFTCQANLKSLFEEMQAYKVGHQNRFPKGGGSELIWRIWNNGEKTEKRRDLCFCPENRSKNAGASQTAPEDVSIDDLWRTKDDFSSENTDYYAIASKYKKQISSGKQVLFADNNVGGFNHQTKATNVIYGDGNPQSFAWDDLREQGIVPDDDPEYVLPVGPDSPVPALQRLSTR